jgi:hypothetical protein
MAPKEKAIQLVRNFMQIDSDSEKFDGFRMGFFYAQRCALIAVDEVLYFMDKFDIDLEMAHQYKWYKQVKKEIENI